MSERERPSARAPERAQLRELDRKSAAKEARVLVRVLVAQRRNDGVLGDVSARKGVSDDDEQVSCR